MGPSCPEMYTRVALSTGCEVLDTLLGGGLLSRALTELSGESASGKTQFCLQLCVTAQLGRDLGGLGAGTRASVTRFKFVV